MTAEPRHILVVFGGYGSALAGAERMAWRTIEQLGRRGHTVVVLTDSVQPAHLGSPTWRTFATEADLAQHMPGWRPDFVHACDLAKPDHVAMALRIAEAHGALLALTPSSAPGVWPDRRLGGIACRAADVVFGLGRTESNELMEFGVPAGRIHQIPLAPDLVGIPRAGKFRRQYSLDGQVVLFAGRRTAFKGYRALLEAGPLVWDKLPGTTFVFAGPNSDNDAEATFRAHADPRVVDLGVVDEQTKHDAIAACDILCLPTSMDVFPLVFMEAWTCGKPVVSGDYAGAVDVVRHGIDGLITRTTPEHIAAALVSLLIDDETRLAMGKAGLVRAGREFGWDKVAAGVEAGYRAAIEVERRMGA